MPQSKYYAQEFREIGIIAVVDLHGARSVTNDAEAVVENLKDVYGGLKGWRILYRDSMGNWDELRHNGETFTGFRNLSDTVLKTFASALTALGLSGELGLKFDEELVKLRE